MKKAVSAVLTISKNMLCIGFGIQIILGVIWMYFNLLHLQVYSGQGSGLFLQLAPLLTKVYPAVYLLQSAAAIAAGYYLFRCLFPAGGKRKACFGALALFTFPMGMQCHLAIAPFSLVSSLTLVMLSCLTSVLREKTPSRKCFAAGCLCWVGMSFLLPVYFGVGLAMIVCYFVISLFQKERRRGLGACLVMAAAFCGLILSVNALALKEQMIPDAEQRAYSLCSRMSWPTLMPDHERWPAELNTVVEGDIWEISLFADRLEAEFRPLVTGTFGKQKAAEYYRFIAADSWNRHKKLIARQIVGDFAAYTVTPVILPVQLEGKAYASYSGRNYEFFLEQNPKISKMVLTFFLRWFLLAALLSVMTVLLQIPGFWKEYRRQVIPVVLLFGFTALTAGLIYTFRGAGIMDYKCTVFVNLLWLVAAFALTGKEGLEK